MTREVIRWFFDVNKNELVPNSLNPEPEWFGPDFAKGLIGLVQVGYWFTPQGAAGPRQARTLLSMRTPAIPAKAMLIGNL